VLILKRKRIFIAIASLAVGLSILMLAGCFSSPLTADQIQDNPAEVYQHGGVHQISSLDAREIAVDFVGYGVAHDVLAFTDQDALIFEVDVRKGAMRYVVLINAESGNVTSLSRYEHEYAITDVSSDTDTALNKHIPHTTTDTKHPTTSTAESRVENRPSNSAISLDRAIEIANADLASRGISATYRSNSGIDRERGQRVWELLFVTNGEHMPFIEYYINADNGNIVKFEWDD